LERVVAIADEEILTVLRSLPSLSVTEVSAAVERCHLVRRRDRLELAAITALYVGFVALQFGFVLVIFVAAGKFFANVLPGVVAFFGTMGVFWTTLWLLSSNPRLLAIGEALKTDHDAFRSRLELIDDTIAILENQLRPADGNLTGSD
jgi:hypothetical protein